MYYVAQSSKLCSLHTEKPHEQSNAELQIQISKISTMNPFNCEISKVFSSHLI
jgi:hypothetical protein